MTIQPNISERSSVKSISDDEPKTLKQRVNASSMLADPVLQQSSVLVDQKVAAPTWSAGSIFGAIIIVAFFVTLALAAEFYDVALFEECYVNCDA